MNKYLKVLSVTIFTIISVSWGHEGHHIVGLIAERHLTPQAKAAVKELLNGQSLSEVASWADEVRNQPQYKYSAPQHFANFPSGLTYKQFSDYANDGDMGPNVIFAIPMTEATLMSSATPFVRKVDALKFLVHYVGDIHQPMHVSHKEDKGGNTIQVQFEGKGTNLHSLWDSKLIDRQGLTPEQIADEVDHVSLLQSNKWLQTSINQWAWESYQISEKLYAEVVQNNKLDDKYYQSHIDIVNTRLEQAGLRLANELNRIFKDGLKGPKAVSHSTKIDDVVKPGWLPETNLKDVAGHVGEVVLVQGGISDYKDFDNMTLINLGAPYPNQLLTVVVKGEALVKAKKYYLVDEFFHPQMATKENKLHNELSVKGKVIMYKGKPEIEVTNPDLLNSATVSTIVEPWGKH